MNKYEVYEFTVVNIDELVYEFTSTGPKGPIKKLVQFQKADVKSFFLAFGNRNADGTIDDLTTNDNKDRNKILATVAFIAMEFMKSHADSYIFFTGSTEARTRLYRIAISINYQTLSETFHIWGLKKDFEYDRFQPAVNYRGFLVKYKNNIKFNV